MLSQIISDALSSLGWQNKKYVPYKIVTYYVQFYKLLISFELSINILARIYDFMILCFVVYLSFPYKIREI